MALYVGTEKIAGRGATGAVTVMDIAVNTNLNDLTTVGFYQCVLSATAATLTNSPVAIAFSLLVEKGNGYKQTLTEYLTDDPDTWERTYYSGVWGAWKRKTIQYGTAAPSGGSDGDIYFRYV